MATVVFRYDNTNGNSQQKWESFKTKKEAQKRKSEVEHEIDTGTFNGTKCYKKTP